MAEPTKLHGEPPAILQRAFTVTAKLLRRMGTPPRHAMADLAGSIAYALQPPAKRVLCATLHSRAAGGLAPAEARRRARASYRNYSRMIVDTLWVHAIGTSEMFDHGAIEGAEHLDNARDAGRGGILVLIHFGSWDIAASLALAAGHPVTTVMAPVGPAWTTELLAWSRRVKHMELFSPSAAARGLLRALRAGRILALLIDIPEGGPTTTVSFCRGPVQFSTGPAFLARLTGAPILPAECWWTGTKYIVRVYPPYFPDRADDEQAVIQHVASLLERKVHLIPDQWYPFNEIYEDRM